MSSLTLPELLNVTPSFSSLPATEQEVYLRLAEEFDDNPLALHLNPQELQAKLQLGNKHLWQSFLTLEPVKNYIKQQMQFNAQVASRKAFAALERQANSGDTTAAKQINDLAGIFDQVDTHKIIVMHQIKRPNPPRPKEPTQ